MCFFWGGLQVDKMPEMAWHLGCDPSTDPEMPAAGILYSRAYRPSLTGRKMADACMG